MKKDLIIGSEGMIGKAIYKCYGNDKTKVLEYDIKSNDEFNLDSNKNILVCNENNIRCMHICIPCVDKKKFIEKLGL